MSAVAPTRHHKPSVARPTVSKTLSGIAESYDALLLRWAAEATSLTCADRVALLDQCAANRRQCRMIAIMAAEGRHANAADLSDALNDDYADVTRNALTDGPRHARVLNALYGTEEELSLPQQAASVFSQDVRLELCHRQQCESVFGRLASSDSWGATSLSLMAAGLSVVERTVWQPQPMDPSILNVFTTYGRDGVTWVRLRDAIQLDADDVRLVNRTLLFQPDDSNRGQAGINWKPRFGSVV